MFAFDRKSRRSQPHAPGVKRAVNPLSPEVAVSDSTDNVPYTAREQRQGHDFGRIRVDREGAVKPFPAAGEPALPESGNVLQQVLSSPGRPLDTNIRSFFENRMERGFGRVRIHRDGKSAEWTRALHAAAFTAGSDIVFAPGAYRPETARGRELIAHELVHVAQNQSSPTRPAGRPHGSRNDPSESQADSVARSVSSGLPLVPWNPVPPSSLLSLAPEEWFRGEAQGVPRAHDASSENRGVIHDLGEGTYFSDLESVAREYAGIRSGRKPEIERVLKGRFDPQTLGSVLDLTKDPKFMEFYNRCAKTMSVSGECYRNLVENHLRIKGLKLADFDFVIGPEGVKGGRQMRVSDTAIARVRGQLSVLKPGGPGGAAPAATPEGNGPIDDSAAPARDSRAAGAPRAAPAAGEEHAAVRTTPTPPASKIPRKPGGPAAPRTGGQLHPAMAGAVMADIIISAIAIRFAQADQKLWDQENERRFAKYLQKLQPEIQARANARERGLHALTDEGLAAYGYVTLNVTYQHFSMDQIDLGHTSLVNVTLQDVTIDSSPRSGTERLIPLALTSGDTLLKHFVLGSPPTRYSISFSIKLADSLDEQERSATEEINDLEKLIVDPGPGSPGGGAETDGDLKVLFARRDEAIARLRGIRQQRAGVRKRQEERRQAQEREERRKEQEALRKFQRMQKEVPEPRHENLLPGVAGKPVAAEWSNPLLAGANEKLSRADEVSRLFVAQKNKLVNWADDLRASAGRGQARTPEYAASYEKFRAMRNPWPEELRESLDWLRTKAPEAEQAIQRMGALNDWLKNGGWDSLRKVPKPD